MILFLTTADTEILAVARATGALPDGFGEVRCVNPVAAGDDARILDEAEGAAVVLLRLLGGLRAWPAAADLRRRCVERRVPFLAFGGEAEPDAELAALSTAPAGIVAEAFEYLRHGGAGNVAGLLRFVADTLLYTGFGFDPPATLPEAGVWLPEGLGPVPAGAPRIGIVFYRAHWMSGNTGFVEALARAVADAGGEPVPVYCYSLRPAPDGRVAASELLDGRVDALIVTVLASGGSGAADAFEGAGESRPESWAEWHAEALDRLDVPVVQGICATAPRYVRSNPDRRR